MNLASTWIWNKQSLIWEKISSTKKTTDYKNCNHFHGLIIFKTNKITIKSQKVSHQPTSRGFWDFYLHVLYNTGRNLTCLRHTALECICICWILGPSLSSLLSAQLSPDTSTGALAHWCQTLARRPKLALSVFPLGPRGNTQWLWCSWRTVWLH